MNKQDKKGIIILSIIGVVIIAAVVLSIILPKSMGSSGKAGKITQVEISDENKDVKISSYKKEFIAAVYIEGTIEEKNALYDQKWLVETINNLKDNKRNAAIALFLDTPGGSVYCADEVYLALQEYKTTGRPIYAYHGPMCASGGYYISCAADQIFANRNTLTGCIGVIAGQALDLSKLMDKLGIKLKIFHSGRNKVMGSPDKPLTEEQIEIMQTLSDEAYEQFVTIVANGRGMSYEKAQELSDGRIYSAKQGLENGLVDRIDSWENMLTVLAEDTLEKPGIKVVEYKKDEEKAPSILDFVMSSVTKIQKQEAAAKLGVPTSVIDLLEFDSYPAYLYTGN